LPLQRACVLFEPTLVCVFPLLHSIEPCPPPPDADAVAVVEYVVVAP